MTTATDRSGPDASAVAPDGVVSALRRLLDGERAAMRGAALGVAD